MRRVGLAMLIVLAACSRGAPPSEKRTATPATGLEAAAIQAGVIPDPADTDITGLYARDTDRVCIVPGATAYRIGVYVDYDEQQNCGGSGIATRVRDTVHVQMDAVEGCSFDARFEGDRLVFPGRVPDACQKVCSRRASLAALDVDRLSESVSEASTLRDGRGRLLCASGG
ncbi:hypothetical protein QH494_03000 [Sphingomonas sp. AR_OL41]|uniref:hypothetical protein n=1 Tax=Sphingomonas sp. AR_OL41 TaxID=3042729 RepID=UPI00247FB2D3|nr:hypothetical protein [Sphingomonas sp. AR_OL41]MDH7971138.1 hypothetical protein [Sphingomonas sp. AR_OL41]